MRFLFQAVSMASRCETRPPAGGASRGTLNSTERTRLLAITESGQDEAAVQRVNRAVAIDVGGVAGRIACTYRATKACEYVTTVERINGTVTVGVTFAGKILALVGNAVLIVVVQNAVDEIAGVGNTVAVAVYAIDGQHPRRARVAVRRAE